MTPRVSIVLLTRNGQHTLPEVLKALWSQQVRDTVEVVAIDSGSTDGTLGLLENRVDTIVRIRPDQFNHGATRNQAIGMTRGEFVILLVQDALPIGADWIEAITAPLARDRNLAGTFARQVPRPEARALTRHYLDNWVASSDVGWTSTLEGHPGDVDAMPPMEQLRRFAFDNVASCIRRSVWEKHPFQPTPIAEDLRWAREVVIAGYSIAFVPAAVVQHSHERSALYEYRRTRMLHEQLFDLYGLRTITTRLACVRAMMSSAWLHLKLEGLSAHRWPGALALAVAWPLGQYIGGQNAERGLPIYRLPPGTV